MTSKIERISTGVEGLDKLMEGGIPKGSSLLISGAPGTGKSTLASQFIETGLQNGEKCCYVSIEQDRDSILMQNQRLGIFKDKEPEILTLKDLKSDVLKTKPKTREDLTNIILDKIESMNPDRVVLDSINALMLEDSQDNREVSRKICRKLTDDSTTAILIGEALSGDYPDEYTPFLMDGAIVLYYINFGPQTGRSLLIKKMRFTEHSEDIHPIKISTGKGFQVIGQ